jgi:1-acyl-sn-glycerol-3-phosphate acyltransferase
MLWAMAPNWWYLFHYRYFSWNLPAGDFFKKRMIFRVVAYLTKCIFIHRDGSKEHKNDILARCRFLVERGNALTIFPEGTRSRTGRFETAKITYGVGKLVSSIPHSRVLCVYLRGHRQTTFSNYPPKNSRFSVRFKLIDPRSQKSGKDAYYETAQRIAHTIHSLEEQYFATR